jgi:ABC-type lipoprotein release transport system permease subunit
MGPRAAAKLAWVALALILLAQAIPSSSAPQAPPSLLPLGFDRVEKLAAELSGFGSRMTGYPGYYKAADFIYSYLRGLGLQVINQTYKVLVPVEVEAYVEALEPFRARVKAYSLYPNGVNPSSTPPEGLVGPLIYVGKGDLSSFDGKEVNGSIVAMDFNSQDNWLNAAKLGAKAVIFIEPEDTTYYECDKKFLDAPLGFPRLYVKRGDWELLKGARTVRVVSRVEWREVEAKNFIAVVNGSSPRDVIVVAAHFDAWSVVPGLASSRTEAVAPALLLELARYLRENPPRYTVWLAFLSGHWQALAGARAFVERFFFSGDVASGKVTVWGFIGLDKFASDSDGLQLLHASYYTTYGGNAIHSGGFPARLSWVMTAVQRILAEDAVSRYARSVFGVSDARGLVSVFFTYQGFWGTEPIPYMLDSEAASISGVPAFSIVSRRSSRLYYGIPIDDAKYANFTALKPYLELASYIVVRLLNTEWQVSRSAVTPTRYDLSAERGYPGFTVFHGRVVAYNFTKGWYDPVPHAIVEAQLITSGYKLNKIFVKADENGTFTIYGIPHAGRGAYGGTVIPFSRWILRGWVLDGDGNIVMATDLGQFGMQNFPLVISVLHPYENVTVVVAKSFVVELFDVNLPTTLSTPSMPDPRTGYFDWWRQAPAVLQPYELLSKSFPLSYGFYYNGWEPVALVWVQPGVRFAVVGYVGMGERAAMTPILLLTNSTAENTEGFGFTGPAGGKLRVAATAYAVARDLYYVSLGRYRAFTERHVGSPSADASLSKAAEYLRRAEEAFKAKRYSEAYAYALVARAYAYKAYVSDVMPLVNDAARSMLYMFPLVAFAAFFIEKVFFHSEGVRRIAYMAAVAAVLLWLFSLIHPAFVVVSNISLGMIGSLITIILIVTLLMLGAEGEALRSAIERRVLGVHRSEVSRMDTAMTAFSMGSEYIRRRPLRTALMLATLIAMTVALTSFTSLMPTRVTLPVARYGYRSSLDEILIKSGRGVPPATLTADLANVAAVIAGPRYEALPRAWVYPPVDRGLMQVAFRVTGESGRNGTVAALVGITAREFKLLYSQFVAGPGIVQDDGNYAVISKALAQNLSVTLGDKIYVMGQEFVVTGIVESPEAFDKLVEADGYSPMPADPMFFQALAKDIAVSLQAGATPPNLGVSRVVLIPYRKALELNGYVASVALLPKLNASLSDLFATVRELAYALDVPMWFASGGSPYTSSTFTSLAVGGWEMVATLLVIGALNVAIMVLGNLKERTREIYVLSAVGLSPMGVTVFFVAEVLVYVVVGTVLGYLLGYGVTMLMIAAGALPAEHVFNFASAFTIVGTLAIIGASLAAVAYPSYLASRLITPSLERKWRPPTKPRGDLWEIPLPMSVPSEAEARGVLAYLHEYYSGAGAVKEGVHVVREVAPPDYQAKTLSMTVALAPLEAGVQQKVEIEAVYDRGANRYVFLARIRRLSGPDRPWVDGNYKFVDDLRKQMLMWTSLPPEDRRRYIRAASAS